MELTPDQLRTFQTAKHWKDFRALFPQKKAALDAHATAASRLHRPVAPTHHIEWRHLYDDRETTFLAFLALLSAPLGISYTRQNSYRFMTAHAFTKQEWKRLMLGRALGSICYHICFVLILLCGAGLVVGLIAQLLYGGFDLVMTTLAMGSLVGGVGLWNAAAKSRSLGLPEELKPIAKDIFDLVSIRSVETTNTV